FHGRCFFAVRRKLQILGVRLVRRLGVLHFLLALGQSQVSFRIVRIPQSGLVKPADRPLVVTFLEVEVAHLEIGLSLEWIESVLFWLETLVLFRRFLLLNLGLSLLLAFGLQRLVLLGPKRARQK